jgi:hypothetical protein
MNLTTRYNLYEIVVCKSTVLNVVVMRNAESVLNLQVLHKWKQEILGRINRLLSFEVTESSQKMTPPTILRCSGNVFTELLPSNSTVIHRQTHRYTPPTILLVLRAFLAAGTCLPSRCLANEMRDTFHRAYV